MFCGGRGDVWHQHQHDGGRGDGEHWCPCVGSLLWLQSGHCSAEDDLDINVIFPSDHLLPLGTSWQQGEYCEWCVLTIVLWWPRLLCPNVILMVVKENRSKRSEVFSLVSALALFLIFLDPIPRFFTPAARLTQDLIWEDGKMASIGFHHLREIAFSPRDHFPAFVLTHPDNNLIHNELLAATSYHLSYIWKCENLCL